MTSTSSQSLSTKDSRMRIYSCEFCEFIQVALLEMETGGENIRLDPAYEAKYLFHLRTVHGLER
jgi:hypothetical protein